MNENVNRRVIKLRRQSSLVDFNELNREKHDMRKYYSFCFNNRHLDNFLLNCDLEWDETDLMQMNETDTWSNYDIDEHMSDLNFREFEFEMINFCHHHHEKEDDACSSSVSSLKQNKLFFNDNFKSYYRLFSCFNENKMVSKSVTHLSQNKRKYLCLKSKHLSLLDLNENIKYCLIKKKKQLPNFKFFRLTKINIIIAYLERLVDKIKSIIYKKRQNINKNHENLLDMVDDDILNSYDII